MKKKQILRIIKNGGATLDKNGKSINFVSGYQVSTINGFEIDVENINKILQTANELLHKIRNGEYVGVWIDDGKAYVDISAHIISKAAAVELGHNKGQKAIFDWKRACSIYL